MVKEYYYKVPKKNIYAPEYDTEGNIIGTTDEVYDCRPDVPEGINFVAALVGDNYFVKTSVKLNIDEVDISKVPINLTFSRVKGGM